MHNPNLETELAALIESLPTRSEIYLPTSKISLPDQLYGLQRVKSVYEIGLDEIYRPALLALREKYAGTKRAFIIGNGPSLNDTDLSLLKDEVTFCVNGFFLKMPELGWEPTFYMVEDHLVAEDRAEAINALTGPLKLFPAYLAYCIDPGEDVVFFNHRPRKSYPRGFDFTSDAASITYTGCTVTFTAMQLAHWLGFEEIYLIGVDASYSIPEDVEQSDQYGVGVLDMGSDDPNHFHPDYFGKGYRWHDPQVDKMLEAYSEARNYADAAGRPIYNATVGGELEVFQRVDFKGLFPVETAPVVYPRVAVIDMTPLGGGTATGNLKADLFAGWPAGRVLSVSSNNTHDWQLHYFGPDGDQGCGVLKGEEEAVEAINAFDPDVILYRPVPEKQSFHQHVMRLGGQGFPTVIWVMDDWIRRLEKQDPAAASEWSDGIRNAIESAAACLSISRSMADEFKDRYSVDFVPVANGVRPGDWPEDDFPREDRDGLLIRYAGGLASDMSLRSLVHLAAAVEASPEAGMRLEINTREHWFAKHHKEFEGFSSTRLTAHPLSDSEYRRWLSQADVVVIAYNFSEETVAYTRYSRANKLPECLASGAISLAIGPREIATIEEFIETGYGVHVADDGPLAIEQALETILRDRDSLREQAKKARAYAFEALSLATQQEKFRSVLSSVARKPSIQRPELASHAFQPFLKATEPHQSADRPEYGPAMPVLNPAKRTHRLLASFRRVLRFYKSGAGLLALLTFTAAIFPAVFPTVEVSKWAPAASVLFLLVLIGHVCSLIVDALSGRRQ